ncbi:nucleoid-associated protein YejK [Pseudomonas marginalis]|uniref:nucleoid-associated protein n=1 Tax=Pseudomonas marginalis TaxID=298 RepID=UPI0020A14874|nr:nucleoid-associated protein [Pseudomonas marginalis]MCP1507246.1 nucleoid-associated protein YejK [Pseudomonas marginalis]MCP1524751.1 nucleoid-associated protein YejK [Pseudomonas marginalis]MDQ0502811.1 nucleoid-associated protein YejK [Pseudomonas marginalis]
MPVRHSAIHKIDKKPDGSPAVLHLASAEQVESQARDDLMLQFNESYNATAGKAWGFFHHESGALPEESAREKTQALVSYSIAQAKLGEPITLGELSELIDEDQPKNFYDFIKAKDYGLSETRPPDKKTLNKFRRFTGRAEGMSISFEAHLLGDKIEFNEAGGTLTLRGLPTQLTEQLKRAAA